MFVEETRPCGWTPEGGIEFRVSRENNEDTSVEESPGETRSGRDSLSADKLSRGGRWRRAMDLGLGRSTLVRGGPGCQFKVGHKSSPFPWELSAAVNRSEMVVNGDSSR